MAYITGVANTARIFMDAIQAAAVGQGWTLLYRGPDPLAGSDAWRQDMLHLSNADGLFIGLSPNTSDPDGPCGQFAVRMMTDYLPGESIVNQPDETWCFARFAYIPCAAYHIFATASYIYVVVEGETKHFRHFGWGTMVKQDDYPGGGFVYGHTYYSNSTNYFPFYYQTSNATDYISARVLVGGDGDPIRWRSNHAPGTWNYGAYFPVGTTNSLGGQLFHRQSAQFNRQIVLVPVYGTIKRQGGYHSPIGYPPNMRLADTTSLGDGMTDLTLGPDTWRIFPMGKKGSTSAHTEASYYGMAYQVI